MVKVNYEKLNKDKANAVANANNNKKPGLSVSINYDKINAEATFNDNLIKFRNERSDYFKAKNGWKSENSPKDAVNVDAYTSYDSTKPTSKDDVITAGNELAEKVRNGTATDDDYRKYVNAEALYGEGLYNGFQSRIEAAPKYHVAPVVDTWDKTGIAESELWKTEDEYKKDASELTSEMQSAYGKYAKGEMSDADINILADKYQRFAAKEKAYFSDRYQKTGTLATADALKLRRDAARDANAGTDARIKEIDMEVANARRGSPEYFQGLFAEKAALENSKTNVDYKDTEGKYYSALQFEAEKADEDNYNKYVEDYTANVPDSILNLNPEQVEDKLYEYTGSLATPVTAELIDYGTEDELKTYLYLFEKYGKETADNYARSAKYVLNKRVAEEHGKKYENSNALERFGMGVGAIFEGGIGDIGQSIAGLGKAVTGDTSYTHRNTAQQKADAVIEAEQNPVADLLMQGGRSAVANSPAIIAGIATGGSSLASTSVLFASAAGSAYVDAINKGNGYFNALGYGIANGAIEAATEKLFDIPGFYGGSKVDDAFKGIISKRVSKLSVGTKGKTALNFLGYMAANGFGEAVEEGITAAVEPTLGNIFLGEKNESFTAEHFGEIGYAALLGTVSSFLMPLSYVSTYADAKGDTAVRAIFNGEKITDKQIDAVVGNESSRTLFEKIMGFELSENKDIAKAQVKAVASSVKATSETIKGKDISSVVENIDASSVAEYTEAVSDYITEPDAEYIANETEAVAEMTEIANEELAKTSTGAVQRIIEGTANSNDYHAVSKDAEARAEFTKMTGVELSAIPGEARSQMRAYASQKASDSPSETLAAVTDQAVDETVSDLMDGVSTETASINEGVETDEELADYGVSDRQAALERAVDGDGEIARLTERYESGAMSEAEYNEAVTRRVSEIERSISESDGDVSEVDSVPVADGVTENGGTSIMSKDDFDIVRNNSYSVTRNSAKDIKSNPIFAKVSAAEIRAFRAVGKALGVDVKAFDGEALGLTGTDGAYDNKTRTIYLNVTSPLKAISSAFRHEVIHYLKVSSPKAYGEFAAFVIDKYKEQYSNEDYNAWLEAKREEYEAMGETLTRDGAEEEFLAQFGMDMLQQKAIARDFVRHHRSAAMKVWDAIRNLINKIRRFYGMQELPTSVYDAISQLAENTSGQIQVSGNSYTRSHLQGSEELLPEELNIDALNAADEALLNAFAEVADINKRVQAKLKSAPEDVLNDDVKRAEYIGELWAEETGVEVDNNEQIRYNKYWHTDLTKAEVIELSRIIRRDIRTSQNAITDTANWLFTQVNGKDVFAIYSTEEYSNPTILYESKLARAVTERDFIIDMLGDEKDAEDINEESSFAERVLERSWLRNADDNGNNAESVERRGSNRDVGVLPRKSKRRPSAAFRNVLENLLEIRDRQGDGNRGRVDADDSVNTSDEKKSLAKVDNGETKFSMAKPVEQTKDLIAVHNLNSPKLRKALELGGFPMPSIAVTRANVGHDKFGDITLVFGRDTIDPAVDSDNKLYGGDAYTPTFPAVRYEANRNKVDELSTLYDDMRKRFGADDARPLYVYSDYSNAADTLNRNGGEEGVIDYLKGDTNLMQLFLLDKTGNKVDTVMKRTEVKASDEDVKEYEFWLNELGKDFFDGLTPPADVKYIDHARQYFEENKSTVLKTFSKMLKELYGYNAEEANNAVINSPESEFKSTLRRVYLYNKNGSVTVKEEPDYTATREQITKTAKAKGYDKWVEDTFKGIEGKKGIRNDKDPFTPSGKRRSFEDLHFDYTLDNIVRAMKQKNDKGISLLGGSIVGASAKNYKSIDAMKADSARLKQISQNEYDDIQKGFRDRFRELAVRLANGKDSIDAGNLMAEAVAKYNTPSAIKNYIARESRGIYNYSDDIGNELLDIVNGIANMPTGYFEAKPKRAVGFDEVKYAVVPESIDADLRNGLEAVGTKVVTYKDGDSADRLEKLNSDSGVKFSKARVEEKGDISYDNLSAEDYHTNSRIYSYDFLTSQNDMVGVKLPPISTLTDENGKINDNKVVDLGIKNSLSVGTKRENKAYVKNIYTKRELRIDNSTIKHGLDGTNKRHLTNARIGAVIGDVVKNAIPINSLHNTAPKAVGTYAMVSYCYDDSGREFIALVTVEQHTGNVEGVELYDVAHAVSARAKKGSQVDTKSQGVYPIKASTISIADLIEIVNTTHQSILSDDVLAKLGEQRNPEGDYSGKVKFSKSEADSNDTAYIPKGEKPARDINVPAFDDKGKPVSFGARTVLEAKVTPDKFVSHTMEELAKGRYSHEVITDEDALSHVDKFLNGETIENDDGTTTHIPGHSYWEAYDRIVSTKGVLDKNDTALAMHLYNEAVNNVDFLNKLDKDGIARVDKLLSKMIRSSSEAGRTLQAQRLLKKMTPQGLLWDISNTVSHITDDMNRELGKWVETENEGITEGKRVKTKAEVSSVSEVSYDKFLGKLLKGRKWSKNQKPLKINPKLRAKLLNAKSESEAMEVYDEILYDLALQIDSTVSDKLRAWRYMAMLFNPRTHIRNIVGNAVFAAVIDARNLQAALLEPLFVKKEDRRNALVLTKEAREQQRQLRNYAESLFETYENQIKGESRYGESLPGMLDEKRKIFRGKYLGKVLEGIKKINSDLLDKTEDVKWYLKPRFTKTFANAAFARGYTLEDISSGKVTDTQVNELIRYATMEAQKATYRDASKLASILNKVSREHAIGGFILDGVVPFKKTPINIVKRGIEYSPVSIIRGLGKLGKQAYEYKMGKSEYIDSAEIIRLITQGTTGTGLLALGYFLAQMGILSGGDEEEDKLNDLKDARGEQTYSLEIGGYSFTIDWAAPLVMPLFVGAELAGGSDDDADVLSAIGNLATPVLDTSMMSGIMDLIDTVKYSEGGDMMTDLFASITSSYALQYVPSFTAAIARTIDEVDSRGSVTNKTGTDGVLDKFMRKLANKSIIARAFFKGINAPYTDTFGGYKKKETAGDKVLSALQNFVLPGYISEVSDTATTEHMMQLFDSTAKLDMVPGYVNKITVNGESRKLTGNEIFAYKTLRGEHYSEIIPLLTSSEWYNALEDDMKVEVLTKFKELVDDDSKYSIDSGFDPNDKMIMSVIRGGFETDAVMTYLQGEMIKLSVDSDKDVDKRKAVLEMNLSNEAKEELYFSLFNTEKEYEKFWAFEDAGLTIDDYLKARIEKYGIEQKGLKPAAEANEFYSWARDNYGDEKAKVIYSTLPSSSGFVLGLDDVSGVKYADAGLSNDSTNKVLEAIGSLEPLPGKSQVSDFQKASKIISLDLSDKEKMGGLKVVLDDGAYEKVNSAYRLKIGLDVYYGIAGKYDTAADNYSALDDNGKKKMKEQLKRDGYGDMTPNQVSAYLIIEQYGDGLNKPQKAALWQLQNKSWKGDNNPYGENLGNAFRKNMGWDK